MILGDCVEVLAGFEPASVDAVVTDPPYGLEFMGKAWDSFGRGGASVNRTEDVERWPNAYAKARVTYHSGLSAMRHFQIWSQEWADEAYRVLKPGGHLLAFGGTRTYHRLACAIEDAGFEIRDTIAWLYGSGFPKSRNVGLLVGLGSPTARATALKPAHEPIAVARKPVVGTVAANVVAHGTGALNVDDCRVGFRDDADRATVDGAQFVQTNTTRTTYGEFEHDGGVREAQAHDLGRWPANVALDEEAAAALDERTGETVSRSAVMPLPLTPGDSYGHAHGDSGEVSRRGHDDAGGASRFFYVAKASRAERNAGLEGFEQAPRASLAGALAGEQGDEVDPTSARFLSRPVANNHPTVKPIALMRWLVRLVTPPGGLVLDPFLGSGTTGIAAGLEGFRFEGIEREPDYLAIAAARIRFWDEHGEDGLRIVAERERAEQARELIRAGGQLELFEEVA